MTMKALQVNYEGWGERWPLGRLADNGRQLLFEYSPEALAQGLELSPRHLPLRPGAMGDFPAHQMRLPGLMADALPDGWGLLLMDRMWRKDGRDPAALSPLDRLAFVGARAMGALSFEPAQDTPWSIADMRLLALAHEAQAVLGGRDIEGLRALAMLGGSPHGARPKVLVHLHPGDHRISSAPFEGAEPWLVKFQAEGEHREVCAIEHLYAQLARRCGLDVPPTQLFELDRRLSAFGIQRFDIEQGQRVPVHTLAGLLHANFRLPSAVDYLTFLRATRFLTRSQAEVNKAYERAVFNVVFHNRDDHPKNLSYRLGRDRAWRLAPAYDLTFSVGPGGEHQMDVCGEAKAISRAQLLELAKLGGVDAGFARAALDRVVDCAGDWAQQAAHLPIRAATVKAIGAAIEGNRARVAARG